jgi:NAD(P)H-hydrate epimerase
MDLRVLLAEEDNQGALLHEQVAAADVIVDALLGTGARLPIRGGLAELLDRVAEALEGRQRPAPDGAGGSRRLSSPIALPRGGAEPPAVVAVDCPSGLDCDSGELDPRALPADFTVTFAAPKIGQVRFPGAGAIGDLIVADIGCPPHLPALEQVEVEMAMAEVVKALLPPRAPDAHKGSFGKVMIAAGSINYVGAVALAGEAAYRAGSGLVTLAIPSAIHSPVAARLTEPTYVLLPHAMGVINQHAVDVLLDAIEGYDALLIGPGLGRDEKTRMFLEQLLSRKKTSSRAAIGFLRNSEQKPKPADHSLPPMVIDADALNLLSELEDWPQYLPPSCILTPHPGEMARLTGQSVADIQADRIRATQQSASDWDQIVLLKGAFTIIAGPQGSITVIPYAIPALATAGTGDVLAGIIASFLGQGLAPYDAAVAGAFLHGAAGDAARKKLGQTATMAGDLLPAIGIVLNDWGL